MPNVNFIFWIKQPNATDISINLRILYNVSGRYKKYNLS